MRRARVLLGCAVDESWCERQQFVVSDLIDRPKSIGQAVEHVIVEENQHTIGRAANVNLAAVRAVVHRCRVSLQRVLGREGRRATMTDDDSSCASLRNSAMSRLTSGERFKGNVADVATDWGRFAGCPNRNSRQRHCDD